MRLQDKRKRPQLSHHVEIVREEPRQLLITNPLKFPFRYPGDPDTHVGEAASHGLVHHC